MTNRKTISTHAPENMFSVYPSKQYLAECLRLHLLQVDLRQKDVARLIGKRESCLSNMVSPESEVRPSIHDVANLCAAIPTLDESVLMYKIVAERFPGLAAVVRQGYRVQEQGSLLHRLLTELERMPAEDRTTLLTTWLGQAHHHHVRQRRPRVAVPRRSASRRGRPLRPLDRPSC